MCFSASASFTASAILFPLSLYSVIKALEWNKSYLLFSLIPLFFSIHQGIEGVIWMTLAHHHDRSVYYISLAYLSFAFFLWPVYFPLSIYFIEPHAFRKKIIGALALCGAMLGCVIYIPLISDPIYLKTQVIHHAIHYKLSQPPSVLILHTFYYVLIILLPAFFCSRTKIKVFGILLALSLLISGLCFLYAFSSRWCFFAAILSLYVVYIMHGLKQEPVDG